MLDILYISGTNMGMSRMAEGLTRQAAPDVAVLSAGVNVDPGVRGVDEDARVACAELGARCDGDPVQLTPSLADKAKVIVVLGDVDISEHVAPELTVVRWDIPDPADHGLGGVDRYRTVRESLRDRIRMLLDELGIGFNS